LSFRIGGSPLRILVVDDDTGTQNAIKVGLMSQGYEVFTAGSAEDALRIIQSTMEINEPPDLLLTDMRMPGMSGLELIQFARELIPDIRTIIMTAYGDDHVRTKIRKLSKCGYVEKPFQPWVLARMIENECSSGTIL
jgi:DNA-binding NtrC family response regulator